MDLGVFLAGLLVGAIAPILWITVRSRVRDELLAQRYATHQEILVAARAHLRRGRNSTHDLSFIRALADALEDALKR